MWQGYRIRVLQAYLLSCGGGQDNVDGISRVVQTNELVREGTNEPRADLISSESKMNKNERMSVAS